MSVIVHQTDNWPKPGQIYYHFKRQPEKGVEHGAYLVLGVAKNTEDRNEHFVITKPLYFCDPRQTDEADVSYLVRPIDSFLGSVDRAEYSGKRFVQINDEEILTQLRHTFLYRSSYLDC
jgi:hypothetical protein